MKPSSTVHELPLRDPFGISRGTRKSVANLFINLNGAYGEGAPVYYKGQNIAEMLAIIQDWLLRNAPSLHRPIQETVAGFLSEFPTQSGVAQALDFALHDRAAKEQNIPLHQFLRIPDSRELVSSFTIGLDSLEVVMEKTQRAKAYPILKIKVGGENDLEMLRRIQEFQQKPVYVDANEGWTVEQTLEWLPILASLNVQLVEQPLPSHDRDGYEAIARQNPTAIPIIIDEGVQNPEDIPAWQGAAQGINVKLAKCGGLSRGLECVKLAKECGLRVMLGCMIESSLGIAAAACLAPLADYIDLDGAELLAQDPFEGFQFNHGRLRLPTAPGIGVALKENAILW